MPSKTLQSFTVRMDVSVEAASAEDAEALVWNTIQEAGVDLHLDFHSPLWVYNEMGEAVYPDDVDA